MNKQLENDVLVSEEVIRLAVCGIVNAGKSTLLNVLQDDVLLDTGEVRTTAERRELIVDEGLVFIDLPGLDANGEDDRYTAMHLENGVNAFLLVNNAAEGELTALEVQLFRRMLEKGWPAIIVHTHASSIFSEPNEQERIEKLVSNQVGSDVPQFFVDSLTYQKGVETGKKALRKAGGIDQLKEWMELVQPAWRRQIGAVLERWDQLAIEQQEQRKMLDQEEIGRKRAFYLERINHIDEIIEHIEGMDDTINEAIRPKIEGPYLEIGRSKTEKFRSESRAESETEKLFDERYRDKAWNRIEAFERRLNQRSREYTVYTQDESCPYFRMEQSVLQSLRQIRTIGKSNLSDINGIDWDKLSARFELKRVDLEGAKVRRDSYYYWPDFLYSAENYLIGNSNVVEDWDYKTGLFGIEREIIRYYGEFWKAINELRDDMRTIKDDLVEQFLYLHAEFINPYKDNVQSIIKPLFSEVSEVLLKEKNEIAMYLERLPETETPESEEVLPQHETEEKLKTAPLIRSGPVEILTRAIRSLEGK